MESKYLVFEQHKDFEGKTKKFSVRNKSGEYLGLIKWNGAWRKYVWLNPAQECIFDTGCLNDIVSFINELMNEWKETSNIKKEDFDFLNNLLPSHYQIKREQKGFWCHSTLGINREEHWNAIMDALKEHFGDRFSEIYHFVNHLHLDFKIYLRR